MPERLFELAARVPFDDRIHSTATLDDLDPEVIRRYLKEEGSALLGQMDVGISFPQLCRQMNIASGPDECLRPLNVGRLMFSRNPQKYFPQARIEVVEFQDEAGTRFSEKVFDGPLHTQLMDALAYLRRQVLQEKIMKVPGQAAAHRFFNWPYEALEEALANAVYHRSYEHRSPIEVSVFPDRIEVLSFPGPVPPITNADLQQPRVASRDYRNRRIGDFLKGLHLTEGRCTGFPTICGTSRYPYPKSLRQCTACLCRNSRIDGGNWCRVHCCG